MDNSVNENRVKALTKGDMEISKLSSKRNDILFLFLYISVRIFYNTDISIFLQLKSF